MESFLSLFISSICSNTNLLLLGLSETQITDIFSTVGRVVCFRMVFDRDTGRSKGYGFAEYIDAETAASAVRNLDNFEIMGRKLRVDYSSQGYVGKELGFSKEGLFPQPVYGKDGYPPKSEQIYSDDRTTTTVFSESGYLNTVTGSESNHSGHSSRYEVPTNAPGTATGALKGMKPPNPNHINGNNFSGSSSLLPQLPPGIENHPGLTTPDSISKTLAAIPVPQLLRTLIQMKELAITDPVKATQLLRQAPQMSYAVFQSLIMMNLVEPSVLAQLLEPNNTAGMYKQAQTAMSAHLQNIPHQPISMNVAHTTAMGSHIPQPNPVATVQHIPQLVAQPSFYNYPMAGSHVHQLSNPHGGQEMFAAQATHQQQQQQARMQATQEPDKAALLQRVMVLSQEEISRLPAEQQQHILLLKHRLMTEGIGGAQLQAGY